MMTRRHILEISREKESGLFYLLNAFLGAYNRRTDVLAQGNLPSPDLALIGNRLETVHGLVFQLTGKVDTLMATQEERLKAIQGQLAVVAEGINTLQQQLADLKASNPELDDEISSIEATVKAIGEDLNPPAPAPAPEG